MSKWFLLGFGIRAILAVALTFFVIWNFEVAMLYFADPPTILFLTLAEKSLPQSWFVILAGKHPYYITMNLVGCLLWGGIFMLIPLTGNLVSQLRRRYQTESNSQQITAG
jgi:hypothetical protein